MKQEIYALSGYSIIFSDALLLGAGFRISLSDGSADVINVPKAAREAVNFCSSWYRSRSLGSHFLQAEVAVTSNPLRDLHSHQAKLTSATVP